MMGARDLSRNDGQRDIALAHTTATMTRAATLEKLSHYLRPPRTMADKLLAMAERTGARITVS